MSEDFDVVILGGGPAGEAVVRRLDGEGLRIALVERELVGGECAYWACVPSKTLLRAPEVRAAARHSPGLSESELSWDESADYRDFMISHLDDATKAAKMREAGATLVRGRGVIAGPGRVVVDESVLETRHIVVATGTEASIPPIEGLTEGACWTTREVYTTRVLPRDAVVLGGGPVGVETAQMLSRFGVRVTIVEEADRLLAREDPDVGEALALLLAEEGVELRLGASAVRVEEVDGKHVVYFPDGSHVEAERVVIATGRTPRIVGIGLGAVGIEPGESGGIDVDDRCRAGDGVWAAGDVTAVMPFTHVAHYQGEIAADDILGRPRTADYRAIPRVVFTDPEVAAVGLTREQAAAEGLEIEAGSVELETLARTGMYGTGYHGSMTVLADRERGILVGAHAVSPLASEWIGATVLAIKARIPIAVLRDTPMQFPTFGEALSYAVKDLPA